MTKNHNGDHPIKDLVLERALQAYNGLREEVAELEDAIKAKKREASRLQFIINGSEQAGEESIRLLQREGGGGDANRRMPDWTTEEDEIIMKYFRTNGKAKVGVAATQVRKLLPNRSRGSITQRLYRLNHTGALRRTGPKNAQGMPSLMEAA